MVRVARSSVLHGALAVAVLGGVCAAVLPTSAASAACTGTSTNPGQLVRLAGNDRVATAVAISAAAFADGSAGAVVIARRNGFADGLVGGPLSRLVAGPLLLTETGSLNSVTRSEVQRVLPSGKKVYLLGGEQALSAAVAATVGSDGYSVVRLSGDDRYMTAAAVAARFGQPTTVGIASGEVFADALALSAPAAHDRYPLLLVQHAALTTPPQTYLEQHRSVQRINLAGGTAAVSSRVASQLAGFVPTGNLKRWAGADRYATSVAIANGLVGATPCTVTFASGRTFADALAGSAHAAAHDAPLLLLDARVPDSVRAYLEANPGPINDGFLYGGTAAVSAAARPRSTDPLSPTRWSFW
ncbi:MAG: cell wall-binding repeat-containing protein [Candidatus Andersenbacteria bacterium]